MTISKSIYLYYRKEVPEPDTWDFKFSYFFGMIFNQITGMDLKIYSNMDVSGTHVIKIEHLDISRIDAFIIIQNSIAQFPGTIDNLKEVNENLGDFPTERIFQVIKKQVLSFSDNGFISGFQQYKFFEFNHRNMKIMEYDPDIPGESEIGFWEKLSDLAYDIKTMHTGSDKRNSKDNTIYLAEVSYDQMKNREKIKRELLLLGYRVLPVSPLPAKMDDFTNEVTEQLGNSILSINILGEMYGDSPQMVDYSYVEIQNRIFEKESAVRNKTSLEPKLHRIIWTQPIIDIYDEKQIQYIQRIQKETLSNQNTELVQSSITDLIEIIEKKLQQIKTVDLDLPEEEFISNFSIIYDQLEIENRKIIQKKMDKEKLVYQFYDINNMQMAGMADLMKEFKNKYNFILINSVKGPSWISSLISLIVRSKGLADAKPLISLIVLSHDTEKDFEYLAPVEVQLMPFSAFKLNDQFGDILSKLKV